MGRRQSETEKAQRKRQREKHTLKSQMVSSGMLERYCTSTEAFMTFAEDRNFQVTEWDQLDEIVSCWLEHIFHDGEHKTLASDGLAGIQFFIPQALGKLKHSWKLAKVWQKLEPPRRVLPLSSLMVRAMAGAAWALGFWPEASAIC